MKHLTAAIICIAVLYGVDALCCDGWYFGAANQAVAEVFTLQW